MERYEFTPMLGPAEHVPVGSVEWSQRISNRLQIATDTVSYDVEHHVARCLKQVLSADPKPWEVWPGGKPFETPDAWTRAVTGHHWEVLVRIANEFGGKEGKAVGAQVVHGLGHASAPGNSSTARRGRWQAFQRGLRPGDQTGVLSLR